MNFFLYLRSYAEEKYFFTSFLNQNKLIENV